MHHASPLRWTALAGYGLGEMANNFVFSMGMLFLLHYYTDVAGIGAAAAGTLLLVVRIYDAFMDLVAGRIIDRGHLDARHGRFRPWLLWGGVPLLLLNVAVFSVPSTWSTEGRLIYAYVSYALLGTAYSFTNIPYGSLAGVMTQVPHERARLSATRTVMATSTMILLALVLAPALRGTHHDALQTTLTWLTLALAAIGCLFYVACFAGTREIVARTVARPPLRDSIGTVTRNRALQVLCVAALCTLIGASSSGASALYFTRYVLGDAGHFITFMLSTTLFGTVVSVLTGPSLAARFGKKSVFQGGMALAAISHGTLYFAPAIGVAATFAWLAVGSAGLMLAMVVMWALEADTVEYGEWLTGMRLEGLNYSLYSLMRKCGLALGGSIPAFLLAGTAYAPNQAAQTPEVLNAIRMAITLMPAAAFALASIVMSFYPLSERRFVEMLAEIRSRR
ncbi:glucuronide transporter [Uliginosibacterium sp. sgz301328]|uniref:glucuronide transporter n=1 Tax=Uliginosibacterium sp. sgz301328 TaxID=3243764 RepID=UPI00359D6812